ncbi:MAG TPA: CarD family transcriptional regulator [Actinomycetaceae bacterium]|nr:CarD family transcriptional regulator [Actinomycetaceae bacterium]
MHSHWRRVWRSLTERVTLNFSPGQVVVHPHHGPATIAKIANRKIRNSTVRYLKLEVDELSVAIPVDRAEEMGVRALIDTAAVREVFATLTAESEPNETVWSRRMKQNTTRLRSGDINTVAGLVRDLTRRNEVKRLSFGEMTLLRDAQEPLIAELAIVLGASTEDTEAMLHAAILEGEIPTIPDTELAPTG